MRWLVVHPGPEFSVHDVHVGWVEALQLAGEQVAVYNMNDRLVFYDSVAIGTGHEDDQGHPEFRKAVSHEEAVRLAASGLMSACYQFWPDVVLVISGFFTPVWLLEVLRARRHKIVIVNTECPYEDAKQLEKSAYADVALLNDPATIDAYRQVCPVAEYSPHAYRPSVHFPSPSQRPDWDLTFSGTAYQSRIDFFTGMGLKGLKVALGGNWLQLPKRSPLRKYVIHDIGDCLDNTATADLYRTGRTGINFYRREADAGDTAAGWAMGPREIEMAACGLWFLRDPRPESDEVFPFLPSFADAQGAGELLRWALRNDDVRQHGAAKAREAIADRTFSSNAKMLLRLLDRQPVRL